MIDEVIECVFEGAGKQLPLQVYGNETGTGVDVLVAGHDSRNHHKINDAMLMQAGGWGKMRGLIFLGLFLQPR